MLQKWFKSGLGLFFLNRLYIIKLIQIQCPAFRESPDENINNKHIEKPEPCHTSNCEKILQSSTFDMQVFTTDQEPMLASEIMQSQTV